MTKKNRTQSWWYQALQQLHLWIGLVLCIPLVLLGLTGSILVFERELHDLFSDHPPALAEGNIQSVDTILAAAKTQAPEHWIPTLLQLPTQAGKPAIVRFAPFMQERPARGKGKGMQTQILIDPVSLEIINRHSTAGKVLGTILRLHSSLLLHQYSGRSIIGWLGITMLVLSISGIVLWWPRNGKWKAAFTIKRGAKGLRLHRDIHGAVGIWGLAVFVIVSFTGVYLAFPQQTGMLIRAVFPGKDIRMEIQLTTVEPIKGSTPADVNQIIGIAQEAVPDGTFHAVRLPMFPKQPYMVNLAPPGHTINKPTIMVLVDQWQGKVIRIFDPRKYSTGETISAWQRVIHGGYGLGTAWRILIFFSGFLPLLFAITGVSMWLIKRQARKKVILREAVAKA